MPHPKVKAAPVSYADLAALPEHLVGEIVGGELYASPRPASPHARASSRLGIGLASFDGDGSDPGGWVILDEPELHRGEQVVVPDLAGWRRERMPEMPDAPFFELAPDWVCEVSSPSTAILDRQRKMPVYLEAGVQHLWLVDPIARMLEVFHSNVDGSHWLLLAVHANDDKVRAMPFDAIELDLARLWAR